MVAIGGCTMWIKEIQSCSSSCTQKSWVILIHLSWNIDYPIAKGLIVAVDYKDVYDKDIKDDIFN